MKKEKKGKEERKNSTQTTMADSGAALEMPASDPVFFAFLAVTIGIILRRVTAALLYPAPPQGTKEE